MNMHDRSLVLTNPMADALRYVALGWYPIPLCYPDSFGKCACGKDHKPREVGKAPITGFGYHKLRLGADEVRDFWSRNPKANVGILLEPSNLVVLDLDSQAALVEAMERGIIRTVSVSTGKGWHYYYHREDDYPIGRMTQRGTSRGIDVLSRGYVVSPPSIHASGRVYTWRKYPEKRPPGAPYWTRRLFPREGFLSEGGSRPSNCYLDPYSRDAATVRAALAHIEPEDYDVWLHVGFALQSWDAMGDGNGQGFQMWDEWSQRSSKYPGIKELETKWKSFKKSAGGRGLGTIFRMARENKWNPDDAFAVGPKERQGGYLRS